MLVALLSLFEQSVAGAARCLSKEGGIFKEKKTLIYNDTYDHFEAPN